MDCPPRRFSSDCSEGKRTNPTIVSLKITLTRRSLGVEKGRLEITAVALYDLSFVAIFLAFQDVPLGPPFDDLLNWHFISFRYQRNLTIRCNFLSRLRLQALSHCLSRFLTTEMALTRP